MIDHRGPQLVQLVNGYRQRRWAGSWISARQSSQVARSAGMVGRGAAAARLARIANPAAGLRPPAGGALAWDRLYLDGVDAGLRRMVVANSFDQLLQRGLLSFGLDAHGPGAVLHPAGQLARAGGVIDERPEADPLDHAADGDRPAAAGGGFSRRLHHGLSGDGHCWGSGRLT